ncbi:MAG: cell division protein ZapD [Gallionella sp.]|nr:cell division protein ZapD [Gallionella sp.]MDD4947076.1 cell division protein ZapD [Gallionella sp.]
MISYEFPINEKVRTWLRLEGLFTRMSHFMAGELAIEHHSALTTLFEIYEVASRPELKSELLQELDRQKRSLSSLHNNPAISEQALDQVLNEIEQASTDLLALSGKIGVNLRENEWLMSIKQRTCIPGGTCEFDLPSYHYWQNQAASTRQENLREWLTPILPIREAIAFLLHLLRGNGRTLSLTAPRGSFQQMQGGRTAHLLRVSVSEKLACIPEFSANKYAINIRFIMANYAAKSSLFEQDVPFDLTFYTLPS